MMPPTAACDPEDVAGVAAVAPAPTWPCSLGHILSRPLPHLRNLALTRFLVRSALLTSRSRILSVSGAEQIQPRLDPFIFVSNHSQRLEAVLLPALLVFLRNGKHVHFLADWNFLLIPGIATLFRHGQVIPLARKPAKPKFLNAFKPLLTTPEPGLDRARRTLEDGRSIGIFPEGTVNRDPGRLLKGYSGAAQLSLATGTPVVPAGIRFPNHPRGTPISDWSPMQIVIGEPMCPPCRTPEPALPAVRDWHRQIMERIAVLSGRPWNSLTRKKGYVS